MGGRAWKGGRMGGKEGKMGNGREGLSGGRRIKDEIEGRMGYNYEVRNRVWQYTFVSPDVVGFLSSPNV